MVENTPRAPLCGWLAGDTHISENHLRCYKALLCWTKLRKASQPNELRVRRVGCQRWALLCISLYRTKCQTTCKTGSRLFICRTRSELICERFSRNSSKTKLNYVPKFLPNSPLDLKYMSRTTVNKQPLCKT